MFFSYRKLARQPIQPNKPIQPASRTACSRVTTTEDGGLGFAGLVGDRLHLLSLVMVIRRPNGGALGMGFARGRTIDLISLLPAIVLLGFVYDVGNWHNFAAND